MIFSSSPQSSHSTSWARSTDISRPVSAQKDLLGEVHRHLASGQRAEGNHAGERALELADVGLHAAGDEVRDVVAESHALEGGLLLEDGHARLEVRRLDVSDQSPLEPRPQALLDLR